MPVPAPVPAPEESEELSIAEAAVRLGLSQDTVRRRLRAGLLPGRRVATGFGQGFVWRVLVPRVPAAAPPSEEAELATSSVSRLEAALQRQVDDYRTELEARRREVSELHVLLAQSQRALLLPDRDRDRGDRAGSGDRQISWWRRWLDLLTRRRGG